MLGTPCLVKCTENIPLYNPITPVAKFSKKLVIMGSTVGQPIPLIVTMAKKRFLTLSAGKMLYMPVLPKSSNYPLLNRSPAGPTYWDIHLVVAAQAVQLIQLVSRDPRPAPDLPGTGRELHLAPCTGEVVRMVQLSLPL